MNLAGGSIDGCKLEGLRIDGIEVTDLLAAWRARAATAGSTAEPRAESAPERPED